MTFLDKVVIGDYDKCPKDWEQNIADAIIILDYCPYEFGLEKECQFGNNPSPKICQKCWNRDYGNFHQK